MVDPVAGRCGSHSARFEKMGHAFAARLFNAAKGRTYTGEFPKFLPDNNDNCAAAADKDLF